MCPCMQDFYQLLQPGLSMLRYERFGPVHYTHTDFADETGLPADQARLWVDVRALEGDPGDNIPGVKGVGEKTAVQLVKELGTVEQLFASISQEKLELLEQVKKPVGLAPSIDGSCLCSVCSAGSSCHACQSC